MRSTYSLVLAFSLLLLSTSSWGLGLGDISVKSKLGENFDASIPITDTANLDVEQIKASNATAEIYKQLNVDNSFIYQGFNLELSEINGQLVLNISTSESIREPYLNFVLEMKWPSGQINKEFRVFIDP